MRGPFISLSSMSRGQALPLIALAGSLMLACGPREPGPSETEYGKVFYWKVTGSDLLFGEECTDSDTFRDDLDKPAFEDNSFILYRVSDDGQQAIAQSCETTMASTCDDSDTEIVFDISGNELIYDPPQEVRDIEGTTCDLGADELWTLTDQGETLSAAIDIQFNHVGEAAVCDPIEAALRADSDNGQGIDGCVLTITVDTEFHSAQTP